MNNYNLFFLKCFIILIGIILIGRITHIQLIDSSYSLAANNNIVKKNIVDAYRGLIYDRNKKLLVYNEPIFNIMVIPKEVTALDTNNFCTTFRIPKEYLIARLKEASDYSSFKPSIVLSLIEQDTLAYTQEKFYNFPGFFIEAKTKRGYVYENLSNVLGYIGKIGKRQLQKDTSHYYELGDFLGISGLEQQYESILRGKKGLQYKIVDVHGEENGSFNEGEHDESPVPGEDIITTIDIDLQNYAEKLMKNKIGSVVAIEPSTGEILAMVSAPSYSPKTLSGKSFSDNYQILSQDTLYPLFNRALMAMYRPGSVFKILQAIIGLQEGLITPQTTFYCNQTLIGCHSHIKTLDLTGAITNSCNPYFFQVFKKIITDDDNNAYSKNRYEQTKIGLENWVRYAKNFGFGSSLGIDLPNEKRGMIPNSAFYDKAYNNREWKFSNIFSIAIGEGENLVVPLQMANFAATIANKGYFYLPHLIKPTQKTHTLEKYHTKHTTFVDSTHFRTVIEAMRLVVAKGTGFRANIIGLDVCGKTGTIQNKDSPSHSNFIAFAPKNTPQIAVSVYVENAGEGARAAASISGLIIEKYLKKEKAKLFLENYVLKGQFLDDNKSNNKKRID